MLPIRKDVLVQPKTFKLSSQSSTLQNEGILSKNINILAASSNQQT